jgi:hypothetical protein
MGTNVSFFTSFIKQSDMFHVVPAATIYSNACLQVSTNFITCPADPQKTLGIKLPFLVMIIKNLKKYFTFEVQVLDDKNVRRRFRASNYQVSLLSSQSASSPARIDTSHSPRRA